MLSKDKFTFHASSGTKKYGGPTMLKVLLEEIDPTSSVNIELHRQAIKKSRLHDFKNNVVEMTKIIDKHHLTIVSNGYAYDKDIYRRHLLTSLLSGPNSVFNTKIQAIKGDVDSGYGYHASIDPAKLISSAKHQYVYIERCGEWNKVDP